MPIKPWYNWINQLLSIFGRFYNCSEEFQKPKIDYYIEALRCSTSNRHKADCHQEFTSFSFFNWIEIIRITSITASATIGIVRSLFGSPECQEHLSAIMAYSSPILSSRGSASGMVLTTWKLYRSNRSLTGNPSVKGAPSSEWSRRFERGNWPSTE